MKTRYINILLILFVLVMNACSPVEDRHSIGGNITADQLNISASLIVVNGKKSNKVVLENHSPVLSNWDYGTGVSRKQTDSVLLVLHGENKIVFTGLNSDGTQITKTLTVNVDTLAFPVPPEYGYLFGSGEKTWVWDDTAPAVWGNGGYLNDIIPAWWTLKISDINGHAAEEGAGASMIFSLNGSKLTKIKADGTKVEGTCSLNMNTKVNKDDGTVWSKGVLKTSGVSVLCGISPNEGGTAVYEYYILTLDDSHMVLAYKEASSTTAWYWVFKANK